MSTLWHELGVVSSIGPMAIREFDELVERQRDHECPGVGNQRVCVRVVATAQLPTRFGDYHVVGFENRLDAKEHAAFVHGHGRSTARPCRCGSTPSA